MARLYEQRLGELGLELGSQTVIDGRRNVWGRLRGSGMAPRSCSPGTSIPSA